MLKKFLINIGLFVLLLVVNLTFASRLNTYAEKNAKITVILDELESLKSVEFSSDPSGDLALLDPGDIEKDPRVAALKVFFRKYDSPLYDKAEFIVQTSDKYGLDHKLLPAIAMQESNVCKVIPHNSHNCWGWGIYGDKVTRFASYEEAIDTVSRCLKIHYIDKGLKTPDEIMRKYNPSSNGSWAYGVNTFVKALEW